MGISSSCCSSVVRLAGAAAAADLDDLARCPDGVVGEVRRGGDALEVVAARLAAKVDARRLHRVLAERVAHGSEHRPAAAAADVLDDGLRDLHVNVDGRSRVTFEVRSSEQRKDAVGRCASAAGVNDAEPVTVAVPGDPEIG